MVESLLHWLETLNPYAVQFVNFLLLILEGIGLPAVPYEASMLSLGLMIHAHTTTLWEAVLFGTIGNTIGNMIGYYIGPRGLRIIPKKTQEKLGLLQIQTLLEKHGPWMAVISRWFGPLRTLFILYARTAGLKPLPYLACSFIGALSWTAAWQIGMWLGGVAFIAIWHRYQIYGLIGAVVLGVPAYFIYRAVHSTRGELSSARKPINVPKRKSGRPRHRRRQPLPINTAAAINTAARADQTKFTAARVARKEGACMPPTTPPRSEGHTQTLERTHTQRPRLYRVVLLNDDYTPMEFVVLVLSRYFRKSAAEAETIMLAVHRKGQGVAGVYTREVAETKVTQVTQHARHEGYPLRVVAEPEPSA